ncbi:MAG: hypothetical protein ACFHWX_09770 [Bacteroidota bacterium]
MKVIIVLTLLFGFQHSIFCQVSPIKSYKVKEAKQGVAVDVGYFYVINNSNIVKYKKGSGELIVEWLDTTHTLEHLNSGLIVGDSLLSINTNYPESPMASSLEIFDKHTLKHIGNHSFGILHGSATWVDKYQGDWYVAFAHYTGRGSTEGKDNQWTRLVKFDSQWREMEGWILPKEIVDEFDGRSNSGGVILSDGKILITGHDRPILYVLAFPEMGFTLQLVKKVPVSNEGQGIAIEEFDNDLLIYGIRRANNEVVITRVPHKELD